MYYLRLNVLNPYVDVFVIAHFCSTYQGGDAGKISFEPLTDEMRAFEDKIVIKEICVWKTNANPTAHKFALTREIRSKLDELEPESDSYIIYSDCDEIPIPRALEQMYGDPPFQFYRLVGGYFMYSYWHLRPNCEWRGPTFIRYSTMGSDIRFYRGRNSPRWDGAAVHCTYCFPTIARLIKKLQSFSHIELSKEPYINASYVAASILCGYDFLRKKPLLVYDKAEELEPVDHWAVKFLRERVPVSDLHLASKSKVRYWMNWLNCTASIDLDKYPMQD
jgi:beta-1,4-mannosyl-glycoprotein beta-1,4-N-acetylglucosaminyltransferase